MTYSAVVDRDALASINLPEEIVGNKFRITVTPMSEIEERRQAFKRLKGVLGTAENLDTLREERLNEIIVGH